MRRSICLAVAPLILFAAFARAAEGVKPAGTKLTNPLGVRLTNYGKFEDAAWTHMPSIGIRHVFISVPSPADVEKVQKKLADSGLTAAVMRAEVDMAKDSCVDDLAAQLATCEKMGVKYMFVTPKHVGVEKGVVCDRLRAAGNIAKRHKVTIVLETHPDLGTNGDVHLETMKIINHPNVRVNIDTGNITFYNKDRKAAEELEKIIDYVATVEVKDHDGKYESWNFPVLGTGVVDFPAVLRVLEKHNFKGPITMEVEGFKGVELDRQQTLKYIGDSAAYIKSQGDFQ